MNSREPCVPPLSSISRETDRRREREREREREGERGREIVCVRESGRQGGIDRDIHFSHTDYLSLAHKLAHTLSLFLSHTHTLSLSLLLTFSRASSLSLSLSSDRVQVHAPPRTRHHARTSRRVGRHRQAPGAQAHPPSHPCRVRVARR